MIKLLNRTDIYFKYFYMDLGCVFVNIDQIDAVSKTQSHVYISQVITLVRIYI